MQSRDLAPRRKAWRTGPVLGAATGLLPVTATAHTSENAIVLTLPSDLYILGGTLTVALSFVLVALVGTRTFVGLDRWHWPLPPLPFAGAEGPSLLSLALLLVLLGFGFRGTPDPLTNPLPLTVWTLFWIGLTVAHLVFGNLWAALNPWRGLHAVLGRIPGPGRWVAVPPLRYPRALGSWPAVVIFLGFAWFELIYTAPQDPERLARVLLVYFLANLGGCLLFGRAQWLDKVEIFSVYFRIVSWMAPLQARRDRESGGPALMPPGLGLLQVGPLPLATAAFVIAMLSSVSFDGLSLTFQWLGLLGINPLAFPGRSAVLLPNSLGLLATFALLLAAYLVSVWLGHLLAGRPGPLAEALGLYALSVVPIAFGYHLAHYLTIFLVDVQYAAIAFNDPWERGWNLLGLSGARVTASFLSDYDSVRIIWQAQVGIIVFAHVVAVAVAHSLALRQTGNRAAAVASQIPLTFLMICYTLFGLWLLSAPVAG